MADKIRAIYQHACLKYSHSDFMSVSSLSERFDIDKKANHHNHKKCAKNGTYQTNTKTNQKDLRHILRKTMIFLVG